MNYSNKLIAILGPTAVGKTKFAADLAHKFSGEIISADSRQVYIGMDIGTGKDIDDYKIGNDEVPYHLIDVIKPECEFNLFLFTQMFKDSYQKIILRNNLPFLVGGTGMYLSSIIQQYSLKKVDFKSERANALYSMEDDKLISLLEDLNPKLHNTTDLKDRDRLIKAILVAESMGEHTDLNNIDILTFGLFEDREILKEKIKKRLLHRLQNGMVEEVESLVEKGVSHDKLRFFGLEYKFISLYLTGELNYNDMRQKLESAIIQFAKRQMTWFRKMEREGVNINWIKYTEVSKAEVLIRSFI